MMKKTFYLLFIVLILLFATACSATSFISPVAGKNDQYVRVKEYVYYYQDGETDDEPYFRYRYEYGINGDREYGICNDGAFSYQCDEHHQIISNGWSQHPSGEMATSHGESKNTYDEKGNLISEKWEYSDYYPYSVDDQYSSYSLIYEHQYDKKGRLIQSRILREDYSPISEESDKEYDRFGNVVTEIWRDASTREIFSECHYSYVKLSDYIEQQSIVKEVMHNIAGSSWKILKGYDKGSIVSFYGDSLSVSNEPSERQKYKFNTFEHVFSLLDSGEDDWEDAHERYYIAYYERGHVYIWIPGYWLLEYMG